MNGFLIALIVTGGLVGLTLLLVLVVLFVPFGIYASNAKGETKLRVGFGLIWIDPKRFFGKKAEDSEKSPEEIAKKAAKKSARKAKRKAKKEAHRETGGRASPYTVARSIVASVFDYDFKYLKLFKIKKLELTLLIGGKTPCDTATRFGNTCAAVGALYPYLTAAFRLRGHKIAVLPDFESGKSAAIYTVKARFNAFRALIAVVYFILAYRRNCEIYKTAPKEKEEVKSNGQA